MSGDKLVEFVRAGQAAQAAVDKLTGADRKQLLVDAALAASRLTVARGALERAITAGELGEYDSLRNTLIHARRARDELKALAGELAEHFERFTR